MSKFLIVGLGNIGAEYDHTRHNIGFDVADALVARLGGVFMSDRLAHVAKVSFKGRRLVVIKPTTFMNLSGRAFRYWLDKENLAPENSLTIVDDLALPLERIRIRPSGSSAGHNGLRDIETVLGHDTYPKLRFGIGSNFPKGGQVDFVLGRWSGEELPLVRQKINISVNAVLDFCIAGIEKTMNTYNKMTIILTKGE